MEVFSPEVYMPLIGAMVAGAAIGIEREFRARAAGFRTHMLVAVSAALLMLCAVHQQAWIGPYMNTEIIRIDPVRMAHGILTGIGFLCGGVIFREGLTVHGLTTAASLWMASALGTLFGVGLYELGIAGTILTLVVLTVFRLVDIYIPGQSVAEVRVKFARDRAPSQSEFTEMLGKLELHTRRMAHALSGEGDFVEYATTIKSVGKLQIENLAERLYDDSRVVSFQIEPRDG